MLRKNCHLSNHFWLYQLGVRCGYFQSYGSWKREILIWVTLYSHFLSFFFKSRFDKDFLPSSKKRKLLDRGEKRRYAWQETLYMITSSLLFLSISCKVAFSPLYMHIHILPSPLSFVRHLLNFVSSLRFTGDFHEIEKPTKMEG